MESLRRIPSIAPCPLPAPGQPRTSSRVTRKPWQESHQPPSKGGVPPCPCEGAVPSSPASATRSFVLPLIFEASHSCSPLQGDIQPPPLTPDSDPGALTWWLSCPVLLGAGVGVGGSIIQRTSLGRNTAFLPRLDSEGCRWLEFWVTVTLPTLLGGSISHAVLTGLPVGYAARASTPTTRSTAPCPRVTAIILRSLCLNPLCLPSCHPFPSQERTSRVQSVHGRLCSLALVLAGCAPVPTLRVMRCLSS